MSSDTHTLSFIARIAGHTFAVYDSTEYMRRRFAPFLTDCAEPECRVIITPEEIAAREAQGISHPYPQLVEDHVARFLLTKDVLHIHASALRYRGSAFLFAAPSGTGKSTHARLWREVFGSEVTMINDDKPFLRLDTGKVHVCGSPWNGKHDLGTNLEAPLKSICILHQGEENHIRKLSKDDAFFYLIRQIYIWDNMEDTRKIMKLIDCLVTEVPVYQLSCRPTHDAAQLACRIMSGDGPAQDGGTGEAQ